MKDSRPTEPQHRLRLALNERSPARARRFVADAVGDFPRRGDVVLATSELVTNVVRHNPEADELELIVCKAGGTIRVDVRQAGGRFETTGPVPGAPHGRGLLIVSRVSDRWGIDADGEVSVWFEVSG
jgi:anti-sigma regulatory factor (Ser/Thr protein kinase)